MSRVEVIGNATLWRGDCREAMREMAVAGTRFDACVTDPPYELKFMGKSWDNAGVAFDPATWRLAYEVLKPGAHLLAFGGTRTFHRMAVAIEDAGFEIRDCISWLYGSGFPKNAQVQLKPAWEPIIMARRSPVGTVAANVAVHGCGALSIDACRVESGGEHKKAFQPTNHDRAVFGQQSGFQPTNAEGRWPANVIHDESPEVLDAFAAYGERGAAAPVRGTEDSAASIGRVTGKRDRVPGVFHGDTGTAARFFYSAKATARDRAGSKHPTVKPNALMCYLCRLVTPPGGTILDPFAGSGSTLQAAVEEGLSAVGVEQKAEYQADIIHRLQNAVRRDLFTADAAP